jgi:hypothetical protein
MKFNIKFNPLVFQAALAAGGVSLMPFNYLQFAIPHDKGLIKFSDISWSTLTSVQAVLYILLIATMLVFIVIHFSLTVIFLKSLISWLMNKGEYKNFISDPYKNVGIFAITSSLAMTANVFWAPVGFFIPQVSSNLQALMLPSLIFFSLLWIVLIGLEFKVIKSLLLNRVDTKKFNFTWMLDVFSFGLVSLAGSGIVSMSSSKEIAWIAAFELFFILVIGILLLVAKFSYLVYLQIKSNKLPDHPILPAFFIIIPITCLYGVSFYRAALYLDSYLAFDVKSISAFIINASYAITILWAVSTLYFIRDYLQNHFIKSEFSPPQWGMVCGFVGFQVLGVYVHGFFLGYSIISVLNYISVILAVIVYTLIAIKFMRSNQIKVIKIRTES